MRVLFAGDMSFNYLNSVLEDGAAMRIMAKTAAVFKTADYSIINLENIFGNRDEYEPILKSGPNLISCDKYIDFIDALNPTAVGLANNHSGDYGERALFHTMDMLTEHGYQICGAGENICKAYEPVVFDDGDTIVHIIAVCENEFGIATENSPGSAGYNLKKVADSINKSLSAGAEPVIYFHGGNETNPFPSPEKTQLYRHFIDIGAKAVVAMHTHCPQGYEIYKGCPVIYSMGNFFFPVGTTKLPTWNMGYMTLLDITKQNLTAEIIPYTFNDDSHTPLEGEKRNKFMQYLAKLSEVISDESRILSLFESWCVMAGIEGYLKHIKYDEKNFDDVKAICPMKNLLSCEAHIELLKHSFRLIYEGRVAEAQKSVQYIQKMQNFML